MPRKIIAVTGFCGFIGRRVAAKLLERGDVVYGVDSLTYAADPQFPGFLAARYPALFRFVGRDIRELGRWPDVDAVVHLAAHTHVDNSLNEAISFTETNVLGVHHLLEMTLAKRQHGMPRFVYVSTDEVYGEILDGKATTDFPLKPRSPYAASKAAADLLVQAYGTTYGLPCTIVRPTNCYGVGQYPEKLIPKAIRCLMLGRPIPVHGDGTQTRQWLSVDDAADAIIYAMDNAETLPPILNVGGNTEASVRDVIREIVFAYKQEDSWLHEMETGYNRPGCDQRYAVDDSALREHGWQPTGDFWRDLPGIVEAERNAGIRF